MSQIIANEAKPTRANLSAITTGSLKNTVLTAGSRMLICTDDTMDTNGNGRFDAYIEGDGTTECKDLEIKYLIPTDSTPKLGSKKGVTSDGIAKTAGFIVDNNAYVKVLLDNNDHIILAIRTTGDIVFGKGVPSQIVEYVQTVLSSYDTIEDRIDAISALRQELVDRINAIGYIQSDYYVKLLIDSDNNIIDSLEPNGLWRHNTEHKFAGKVSLDNLGNDLTVASIKQGSFSSKVSDNGEWHHVILDNNDNIIGGIKYDGTIWISKLASPNIKQVPHVSLTQSEYDALSDSEKNNGTIYLIKDVINPDDLTVSGDATIAGSLTVGDDTITGIDDSLNSNSNNPVKNSAICNLIQNPIHYFYDANTSHEDISNRAKAIQYVINDIMPKFNTSGDIKFAVIRHQGGWAFLTLMAQYGDACLIVEFGFNTNDLITYQSTLSNGTWGTVSQLKSF